MDKDIDNLVYEVFGICPDYKIVWVDDINDVVVSDPHPDFKAYWNSPYPKNLGEFKTRKLHLNHRTVKTENGMVVEADFAVLHYSRAVYIRICKMQGNSVYARAYSYE